MNDVDFAIKSDVYPQKNDLCSKNIHGVSFRDRKNLF